MKNEILNMIKVAQSTKKIIETLEYNDIRRKVEKAQLEKIIQNGGVINDPKSSWLLDFWGKGKRIRIDNDADNKTSNSSFEQVF